MTGLMSSLLVDETGWLTHSTLALTATVVLLGWWLGVVLLSIRTGDGADGTQVSER